MCSPNSFNFWWTTTIAGRGRGGYNNNNWNEGVRNNVAAFQRSSRGQRYQNTNYALRPRQQGGYNQSIKGTFRPAANGGMRGNRQQRGRGIINRIGKRGGSQRGGGQRGGVQSGGGGRGGQRGRGGRGGRGKPTMDQLVRLTDRPGPRLTFLHLRRILSWRNTWEKTPLKQGMSLISALRVTLRVSLVLADWTASWKTTSLNQ
eukprot:GHVN01098707.1.p1 GENE.GHVN01098707.1~~GHVN01098707.1.p1  ORF type:complete len:203 (+),score=11.55 GHVN01098707.1:444-1052(+)